MIVGFKTSVIRQKKKKNQDSGLKVNVAEGTVAISAHVQVEVSGKFSAKG